MDYTLLEISRILGKSKSTIEYQAKKLTEDQKAAFCFVDAEGVRRMNSAGLDYLKQLYKVGEDLPKAPYDTYENLSMAIDALCEQLRAKDEQINALPAIVAHLQAQPKEPEAQPQKRRLPWWKRDKEEEKKES